MGFLSDITGSIFGGSKSGGNSYVNVAQQPFLKDVYEQAQGLFGRFGQMQTASGFNRGRELYGQGQQFLGGLQQAGQGTSQLGGFTGSGFAGQQIESLADILNRNLSFNLGQIGQTAALGNTTGSGRQGLAQGTAIGDTQMALAGGAADIMQGDLFRRQQAASGVDQFNLGQGALQNQASLGGLSMLNSLFGLSQAGYQNAYQPLTNYANLIGQPTVLNQNSSRGYGQGILGSLTGGQGII